MQNHTDHNTPSDYPQSEGKYYHRDSTLGNHSYYRYSIDSMLESGWLNTVGGER